jgi:acetyltransferase-like isoleucine patch superfamily enzyme
MSELKVEYRFLPKTYRLVRSVIRFLISKVVTVYLLLWGVKVGKNLCAYSLPLCRRRSSAKIEIGNNVVILNKLSENPAGITHPTVLAAVLPGAHLKIGNNVAMSGAILYCTKEIIVEDHVSFGAGAKVYDTDFHAINAFKRKEGKIEDVKRASVRICQGVWIGSNATILKGITIGARSVVGTNAVVTKNVPSDVVVAGVPAKVIKQL